MNTSQHVTTLRQTHRTATSMLPVLTATLTVAGAVIAALEARSAQQRAEADDLGGAETSAEAGQAAQAGQGIAASRSSRGGGRYTAGRVTVRGYLAALVGHVLMVALGLALVLSLVYAASVSGSVGRAILLTALILLALYLTEKSARRASLR